MMTVSAIHVLLLIGLSAVMRLLVALRVEDYSLRSATMSSTQ